MRKLEMSVFAFRLAALYVWIQTILQASYGVYFLTVPDEAFARAGRVSFALVLGLGALLGTALWFASPALARRGLGGPSGEGVARAVAFGELALRIAGVVVLDLAAKQMGAWMSSLVLPEVARTSSSLWAAVAPTTTFLLLGLGLLLGGGRLASRLFASDTPQRPLASELQAVAFSIVGLLIIVRSLPALLSEFTVSGGWFDDGIQDTFPEGAPWPAVVASLLRTAAGLALFLGGGLLARAWHWAHTAGLKDRPAPTRDQRA
jgi:hypothetical protein